VRIGNTAADVRRYLERWAVGQKKAATAESRAVMTREIDLLGVWCPRCHSVNELCAAETGLPASGPHPERILESHR
jgi:hypothetical protein